MTIPNSVTNIEEGGIIDNDGLTVKCNKGSYAEKYVKANQFVNVNIVYIDETKKTAKPKVGSLLTSGKSKYKVTKQGFTVAFNGTTAVTGTISIPSTVKIGGVTYKVTSISSNALRNKTKITKISIGSNVTSIGSGAFSGCSKLSSVILGKEVKTIGEKAFGGCKSLSKISIPDKTASIGTAAFSKCTKLSSVTLGKGVKSIGKDAFNGCGKLKSISIKSSVLKSVGKNALKGIPASARIKTPAKKVSSYQKLFKGKGQSRKVKITK